MLVKTIETYVVSDGDSENSSLFHCMRLQLFFICPSAGILSTRSLDGRGLQYSQTAASAVVYTVSHKKKPQYCNFGCSP